jgi:flagellar basal-body rod protein FlgC
MSISSIAASGLLAASRRLEVSASNIANLESSGPLPGTPNAAGYPAAYSAQRLDQVEAPGGGTSTTVTTASPGTVAGYDPTAPYADKNGMVAVPNVDLVNEAVQQITARTDFAMNAKVIQVESEMMKSLLDIKV